MGRPPNQSIHEVEIRIPSSSRCGICKRYLEVAIPITLSFNATDLDGYLSGKNADFEVGRQTTLGTNVTVYHECTIVPKENESEDASTQAQSSDDNPWG